MPLKVSDFSNKIIRAGFWLTAFCSLIALAATFLISNSNLAFEQKTAVFLAITGGYLLFCAGFYIWQRSLLNVKSEPEEDVFNSEIENKLFALEEANQFFGASLKSADMFRLVASRVGEIVPFSSCVLFLRDAETKTLKIKYAVGENAGEFMNFKSDTNKGLAVKALISGRVQADPGLLFEKRVFPDEVLKNLNGALAVPLVQRGETFGVLTIYAENSGAFGERMQTLLQAAAERAAPLLLSSLSFEQSVSNALTDNLTNLPNERAFFLVLENQLAESQRYREVRPLTVLAMDIRNFGELNRQLGHLTGDKILAFAADTIKKQLRQMDVLTRSTSDEFLAILPTAGEKTALEIIERIARAFVSNGFETMTPEKVHIQLNFGAATFWRDGETAQRLLHTARLRKQQDKSAEANKILWFPKEFVN